jgi:hypothetical protein
MPIVPGALAGAWELRCGYVPYWEQWAIARIAGDSAPSETLNGIRVVKVKDARIVLSQSDRKADNAYEAAGGVEFEGADLALDFSGLFTRASGARFEHRRGDRTVRLIMSDGKLLVHGESGEPPRDTGPEFTYERHIFCEGFKATP